MFMDGINHQKWVVYDIAIPTLPKSDHGTVPRLQWTSSAQLDLWCASSQCNGTYFPVPCRFWASALQKNFLTQSMNPCGISLVIGDQSYHPSHGSSLKDGNTDLGDLPLITNLGNLHIFPAQAANWGPKLAFQGWRAQRTHRSPLLDLRWVKAINEKWFANGCLMVG